MTLIEILKHYQDEYDRLSEDQKKRFLGLNGNGKDLSHEDIISDDWGFMFEADEEMTEAINGINNELNPGECIDLDGDKGVLQ